MASAPRIPASTLEVLVYRAWLDYAGEMPWVRASLRGQTVYARATESGALDASSGKVEIRYKPNDGRRYDALEKNLSIVDGKLLPEDTCGPAESRPAAAKGEAVKKPGAKKTAAGAAADPAAAEPAAPAKPVSVTAYTDGACTGNPGPAGLGVVLLRDGGKKREELSEYLGVATNNIAELAAIGRALDLTAEDPGSIRIHTDSQYAIGVLTKGWKPKANQELIGEIRDKLAERKRRVQFQYVPGHAGVPLNERADELARGAIKTRQTRREQV